ncbi:hypothetical protein C1X59_10260 [Pseudomonas sp. FW215-R2]|jgi:hypothetical protein|uniref:hypothetical protein n=1 Tax=unclassified Pseudomonas TaxID=196821 RepID=UPI000C88CD79|nr:MULTISPECIES: hypothetical protein [unclassified Pseudomonas]PMX02056.1 hypothetical protein C1X59_10260 [Pseudomonas sp. FW215-R2]PMX09503.1 hypothetical protein C1X60_13335 [Pseudomonas sp. FW215-L1]PMX22322.1 hypothetical protein C1X57_14610 [Pseudomonas sp. FW215-E1]PNA31726.1 hypothetical protein C1X58_06480 [Pseudomonas sp. FW215-R4]
MSNAKNTTFTGHLFAGGLPLVINYQVMEQRLKHPRITTGQRLSAEISLNDEVASRIITLADHDDAEPLLFEFVPDNQGRYTLGVKTVGRYFNWRLRMDQSSRHLLVDKNIGSYFELETYAGKLKSFGDLPSNPASVALVSVEKKLGLFQHETKGGLKYFLDRNPNDTEHNAYNPVPVSFVLRTQPSALSAVA